MPRRRSNIAALMILSGCCPICPPVQRVNRDYQFNFAGAERTLSKSSLIRSAVSFLPFAALSVEPMA